MSGECSKSSGELGERYIGDFLGLIGWSTPQYNETTPCSESEKHKLTTAKKGRTKHGIDAYFPYDSPMNSGTLIHIIGSVKHTNNKYPASSNSKFKEHVTDLAQTIECFNETDLMIKNRSGFDFEREELVGVLFWISSHADNEHTSVISNIKNPVIHDELKFQRIHVIDNDRIQFITCAINLMDSIYPQYTRTFHYIDTPNNLADGSKQYDGAILPVEMLSSDIQVFKLIDEKDITLSIVSKDKFHEDNLKRILGLAHRLSNNLTSNVSIFFPKFAHSSTENQNMISRIKGQFREASFINSVYIAGYDIGFKGKIDIPKISSTIPNDVVNTAQIDNGKILPYGEHLRSLLSNSLITESELKQFLRSKGIYFCEPTKENMIPILSSMILSPIDFDELKDKQKTREDREKRSSSKFESTKKVNISEVKKALSKFILNEIDFGKFKNYEHKTPHASFKLEDESKLVLEYEIVRYQANKSWDQQKDTFIGRIILDPSENSLEIVTNNISTSKETLAINQKIIKEIENRLKTNGIIAKTTKEQKILMNDMSNEEVLKFLLSFANSTSMSDLDFFEISSIDIEIDENISLPDDATIKWMEGKIKNLKLDGSKIEQIEILINNTHHKSLKCWGLIAKYSFAGALGVGDCEVEFKFNPKSRNEFFVQITKSSFDKKNFSSKNINNIVMSNIDLVKNKIHKLILDSRIKPED